MSNSKDPLLQPYTLKHLTLRNRLMSTSQEPAYSEDGMPKDRYRLYHVEKAKGGIALTMIGGSTIVSPDSPQAFGNLVAYKDEIVPWLTRIADDVHEHGAAIMRIETGVEEARWIGQRGAPGERERDLALIDLARTDGTRVGPDGRLEPFQFFMNLRVCLVNDLANTREHLATPVAKLMDLCFDGSGSGF